MIQYNNTFKDYLGNGICKTQRNKQTEVHRK